jgi:hypothetical protein
LAKIKCPVLFSQYFNIDPQTLDDEGIFDPTLNLDTKLFIDPLLLDGSSHDLIREQAAIELRTFYENLLALLELSKEKGDFSYKSAINQLPQKEIEGTCLGYGTNSISGRSISIISREKIIETANEIIKLGVVKPELFIILPLFNKGIGSDTISDITTSAIKNSLFEFTAQLAKKYKIKTYNFSIDGISYEIIKNPLRKITSPVLLLPYDILRQLPFATTWEEIEDAARKNNELRAKFNRYIGMLFKAKTKTDKERQLAKLMKTTDGVNTLLEIVDKSKISPYDFKSDAECFMYNHKVTEIISSNPLTISSTKNDLNNLCNIVKEIIGQFKFLIENKGMNTLLWKDKKNPNYEKTAQKIFHLVAYSYCKANNIDISPEMDTGVGNVDFKFSQGFSKKVIVEIKLSTNSNIVNGFSTQLQLYKKSEETISGYYVVIDVGNMGKKLESLYEMYNADIDKKSEIYYIDALFKQSASKRKPDKENVIKDEIDLSIINFNYLDNLPEIVIPDINFPEINIAEIDIQNYLDNDTDLPRKRYQRKR